MADLMDSTPPVRPTPACPIESSALGAFLLLTFGLAWSLFLLFVVATSWVESTFGALRASHPLFILAVYAPAISALLLIVRRSGSAGLRAFLSRLALWRAPPWCYGLLLFGFPLVFFAGAAIAGTAASAPLFTEPLTKLLPLLAFMLVLGPVEELGWRGFALPILQRRLVPFWAGLVLGVVWALWHLPAFLLSGTPQSAWPFLPFFAGSVACSIILTACFNRARGSILLAVLFHFQMNNPLWPDARPWDMYLFVAAAVVVVAVERRALFSRSGAVTAVLPQRRAR